MTFRIPKQRPGCAESAIEMLSEVFQFEVPAELAAALRESNGGRLEGEGRIVLPGVRTAGLELLSAAEILRAARTLGMDAIGPAMPFMRDAFGNFMVIEPDGQIGFWDHDIDRTILVSRTLSDFAKLIDYSAAPARPRTLRTDLWEAVGDEDLPRLATLLKGATTSDTEGLLHSAAKRGRLAATRALICDHGFDVDTRWPSFGDQTPLMSAAYGGQADAMVLLLSLGADLAARNGRGLTIVEVAAEDEDIAEWLNKALSLHGQGG